MYMFINVPTISVMEWHPFSERPLRLWQQMCISVSPPQMPGMHFACTMLILQLSVDLALQPLPARLAIHLCQCTFEMLATGLARCMRACQHTPRKWR